MKLPTIDIAGLTPSDYTIRAQVGNSLKEACLEHGFFYCTGHGVPHGLIDDVLDEPGCLVPGEMPRYEPIRVQDHLRAMYARSYIKKG